MFDLVNKISYTGIHHFFPFQEIKRIKIINRMLLIAIAASICFSFTYAVQGSGIMTLLQIAALMIYALCIYFNNLGFFNASVFMALACTNLSIFVSAVYFGENSGMNLLFLSMTLVPMAVYPFTEKGKIIFFTLVTIAGIYMFRLFDFSGLPLNNTHDIINGQYYLQNITTTVILLVNLLLLYVLIKENNLAEKKLSAQTLKADYTAKTLDQILNESSAIVFKTDGKGNIQMVNPSFEKETGVKKENVIGKSITEFLQVDIAKSVLFYEQNVKLFRKTLRHKQNLRIGELEHSYQLEFYPLYDDDLKITSICTFARDVSENAGFFTERLKVLG